MPSTTTNTSYTTEADSAPLPSRVGRENSDGIIDTTPFLPSGVSRTVSVDGDNRIQRSARRQGLREAARFLRHAGTQRMMREPSMLVRETAAEQLEERQRNLAYSKPLVFLDILWNLSFLAIGAAVMIHSRGERPNMPLRVWVVGYAILCGLHMVCVWVEYRRRIQRHRRGTPSSSSSENSGRGLMNSSQQYVSLAQLEDSGNISNSTKHFESANIMLSFIWWIIGFYWVSAGGQTLYTDSPQLYWLCIIFLGFDIFFVVFCVALAFVIGLALCCCLPCIIAILYAVDDQEGASKHEIEQMPKFRYIKIGNDKKLSGGIMMECGTDSPLELSLSPEDVECCICLCEYEDGVELRELPCKHHFHCDCIDKWLSINSRCPLCKFNILKNANEV